MQQPPTSSPTAIAPTHPPATTLLPTQPPDSASPGAGSAGTSLWRRPRLCSRATQFSAQFPTLISPRKIKPGSQAKAGSALATHAGALGGAHRPLGAGPLLLPPVRAPALRATSRGNPGPAAPKPAGRRRHSGRGRGGYAPIRGPRPPVLGGGGAVTPAALPSAIRVRRTRPGQTNPGGLLSFAILRVRLFSGFSPRRWPPASCRWRGAPG